MISNKRQTDNLAAAVELAEEVGSVFPCWWLKDGQCGCGKSGCKDAGKHPLGKLVPHGLRDATRDAHKVCDWWTAYPKANVALRTGEELWVLDLDGLAGIRAFAQLQADRDLPEGPSARTGGGGRHLYFAPDERIRNASKLGGEPVDVRGTGGYVLVPPSSHESGTPYRWEREVTKHELPEAPGWLIDFVTGGSNGAGTTYEMLGSLADHPGVGEGSRNNTLCRLVGRHLAEHGADGELFALAVAWGQRCAPAYPEAEVLKAVRTLADKHVQNGGDHQAKSTSHLSLAAYSTIEAETVDWVWPGRIPQGKLSIVVGDPGVGKTYACLDIISRISSGRDFPDGQSCVPAECIFFTAEDGAADTIRPRLDLLGADVSKVLHLEGATNEKGDVEFFRLDQHLPLLDEELAGRPGVKLMVVDPITAILGAVDSHKNAEVRSILGQLAALADKRGVAVIGVSHLSKAQGRRAIYRTLGSMAFVAAARATWGIVADPDDEDRRLFLPIKSNLAKATGLAYRITDQGIEWESDPVGVAVDDLDDNETPRDEARDWLKAMLESGPEDAGKLLQRAKRDGVNEKTLRRAKKELRVKSCKFANGWVWALPDEKTIESGGTTWTL